MDEELFAKVSSESSNYIDDAEFVIRQIPLPRMVKDSEGRRLPSESHFVPDLDGLSVNLDKLTSLKDIFIRIALTYNRKGVFLDHSTFRVESDRLNGQK